MAIKIESYLSSVHKWCTFWNVLAKAVFIHLQQRNAVERIVSHILICVIIILLPSDFMKPCEFHQCVTLTLDAVFIQAS